ncbi:hypothetical protein ED853_19170, partial [Acinetobacter baumannii]
PGKNFGGFKNPQKGPLFKNPGVLKPRGFSPFGALLVGFVRGVFSPFLGEKRGPPKIFPRGEKIFPPGEKFFGGFLKNPQKGGPPF